MTSIEDYFGSDDTALPSARLICRDDFCGETFNVDEFLTKSHKYQTLDDLHQQLKKWDRQVSQELIDVVNGEYEAFIGVDKVLEGGGSRSEDVKLEVLRFQSEIKRVKQSIKEESRKVATLYRQKKELKELESEALLLLEYGTRLEDIDGQLKIRESRETRGFVSDENEQQMKKIQVLVKCCVALYLLREKCLNLVACNDDSPAISYIELTSQRLHDIKARVQRVVREELRTREEVYREHKGEDSAANKLSESLLELVALYHRLDFI